MLCNVSYVVCLDSGDDLDVWDNMREAKVIICGAVDVLTECVTVKLEESLKEGLAPGKWAMALFPRLKSACEIAKMGDSDASEHPDSSARYFFPTQSLTLYDCVLPARRLTISQFGGPSKRRHVHCLRVL
jgi:hypothetical protein